MTTQMKMIHSSQRYKVIGAAIKYVEEVVESYRCHIKYLRRHTLTALLCCSPIPYDLFETGVNKTVVLDFKLDNSQQ